MTYEMLEKRVKEILVEDLCYKDEGDYFTCEIYTDYRDREMETSKIAEFLESDNPMDAFTEWLDECAFDYECYAYSDMIAELKGYLSEEELECYFDNEEQIEQFLSEHTSMYYNPNDFNNDVCVNIMLDTGDGNYDFTLNNILNYYGLSGGYGDNGRIDDGSSIGWLAKQQGKLTKLRKATKQVASGRCFEDSSDSFINSVISELINISSHMSTLTFLVTMSMFDLFELQKAINEEMPLCDQYDPKNSIGNGYITISKNTMCGLFDPWQGGGSLLEIKLDKDVKLPIKNIWKAVPEMRGSSWNYGIDEVYGMCRSAWKGEVKTIVPNSVPIPTSSNVA